jgi:hypothetical protein
MFCVLFGVHMLFICSEIRVGYGSWLVLAAVMNSQVCPDYVILKCVVQ